MAGLDLASIIQQAATLNASTSAQAGQISGLMQGAAAESHNLASNLENAGNEAEQATLTRLQGELNTQNARVKVANAYGTNVNAQSDVITGIGDSMRQTAIELLAAQQEAQRIQANSDLLGNPLGWLEDLLTGDGIRAKRDALAQSFDTQAGLAQNLNAATQQGVATQNAISETLSQNSIKQLAGLEKVKWEQQAAQERINSAKYGVASIEALQSAGAQNFNRMLASYNAVQDAERWSLQKQAMQMQLDVAKAERKDIEDMVGRINTYRKAFNLPTVSEGYVKRNWGNGDVGDMLRQQELGGMRINDNGGSAEGALGSTPADAYATARSQQLDLPPAFKPSMDILNGVNIKMQDAIQRAATNPLGKDAATGITKDLAKNPQAMKEIYNKMVKQEAMTLQARIEYGKGNPYEIPGIDTVLSSPTAGAQELRASPFAKFVLTPIKETGATHAPDVIFATALKAIDKGDLTMDQARDGITSFFNEGTAIINATGGFATMNVPAMATYNVPMSFTSGQSWLQYGSQAVSFASSPYAYLATEGVKNILNIGNRDMNKVLNLNSKQDVTTALTMMQSRSMADRILANQGAQSK